MTKVLPLIYSEHDLAKALAKNNASAQRYFYQKYSSKFLAICCRYINDRMQAEDIMVESMMKIFDKVNQFGFEGSFEGWAKRIVVNEALMVLRKNKALFVELEGNITPEVSVNVEHSLEAEDLMQLINELPDGYRTVFNLYAIEGYSHAEIALTLGISEGTSKSQLSRARAILQQEINKNKNFKSFIE
jgi:RNA polymerase sigma-70 factor (ECF subfamily)